MVTASVLLASIVASYTLTRAKADGNEKALATMKVEGCKPSQKNEKAIILIEYRLNKIQSDTQEILKRLPK